MDRLMTGRGSSREGFLGRSIAPPADLERPVEVEEGCARKVEEGSNPGVGGSQGWSADAA